MGINDEGVPPPLRSRLPESVLVTFDVEWEKHPSSPLRNGVIAYGLRLDFEGSFTTNIVYTTGKEVRNRLTLSRLIRSIIDKALMEGIIREFPEKLTLVTHFGRGDLAACKDFPIIKNKVDALKNVMTTAGKAYNLNIDLDHKSGLPSEILPHMPDGRVMRLSNESGGMREVTVTFRDTSLLSSENHKSLEAIGVLVDVPKVSLPDGFDKTRMSWFFEKKREIAEAYLLADLEITSKYYRKLEGLFESLGLAKVPPTLGAASVSLFERSLKGLTDSSGYPVTREVLFGVTKSKAVKYSKTTCSFYTFSSEEYSFERSMFDKVMGMVYHGGRTETFLTGPTPSNHTLNDIDLITAYPTGQTGIRIPDYSRGFPSCNPDDFTADVLGAAKVSFECPPDLLVPLFVVQTRYGLIAPRRGVTHATAPEIASARHLGIAVKIESGVIIPYTDDRIHPFATFVRSMGELRNALKERKINENGDIVIEDNAESLIIKTVSNSLYGKTAQAVRERNVFDSRTGLDKPLPRSAVTNPAFAAYTTGLVRAAVCEMLNSIARDHIIASVSTDGFLTSAGIEDISLDGPSCQALVECRKMLTGSPKLLEVKKSVDQVVVPRNRATFTSQRGPGRKSVTAKGGIKVPAGVGNQDDWLLSLFLSRDYNTAVPREDLIATRAQWSQNADLVSIARAPRVNLEPDHKRQYVNPRMETIGGDGPHAGIAHLALDSVPFETAEDAVLNRTLFDAWRHKTGGCLTDLESWAAWCDFRDDMKATRGAGVRTRRTAGGSADTLKRVFLRALPRDKFGVSMEGRTQKWVAGWLTAAGYRTSVHSVKDAGRPGLDPVPHSVAVTEKTAALLKTILREFPSFAYEQVFVAGHVPLLADVVKAARGARQRAQSRGA